MQYFYRPIPYYNGKILKCAGICTEQNVIWFTRANPGTIIAPRYLGDRIRADDFSEVKA
jgi:hypothetical protein